MILKLEQLKAMAETSANQKAGGKNYSATRDENNFPVWKVVAGKVYTMYFPTIINQDVTLEDGTKGKETVPYKYIVHPVVDGKSHKKIRCSSGLQGTPVADILGYDGNCPLCDAVSKQWDAYNARMNIGCKAKGITKDDKEDATYKQLSQSALAKMTIKASEEYVTLPVICLWEGNTIPKKSEDLCMKPYFLQMRKGTYEDKFIKALADSGEETLGGTTWVFNYSKGKTARDAGKDAGYTIRLDISPDSAKVKNLVYETGEAKYKVFEYAEKVSQEFTSLKADEMLFEREWFTMNELKDLTDKVMKDTEIFLQSVEVTSINTNQNSLPNATTTSTTTPTAPSGNSVSQIMAGYQSTDEDIQPPTIDIEE